MARLASSAGLQPVAPSLPGLAVPGMPSAAVVPAGPKLDPSLGLIQSVLGPASPIPTPCLLIKNMFDPTAAQEEMGPGWAEEIAQDVQEECSKYGPVAHIHVDKASKVGAKADAILSSLLVGHTSSESVPGKQATASH